MAPVVALIAPGMMGSAVGKRLVDNGLKVLTSLKGRSAETVARAKTAGMQAASDEEIAATDFMLSILPPGDAVALAQRFAPALTASNAKPIYVDCNAVAPQTAERIGAILAGSGSAYVDGGIIGAPPTPTTPGARLYVSGERAKDVVRLNAHGLDVRLLGGPVGAASALKMSYAGITKGFTAVSAMMMLGATQAGCADTLHKELADSQPQLLAWLSRQMPKMPPKAYRWVAEMEEIGAFLDGVAGGKEAYEAIARLYERIAEVQAQTRKADDEVAGLDAFCGSEAKPGVRKTA